MARTALLVVGSFVALEIAIRAWARLGLEVGNTIHVAGPLYLTHTINETRVMLFGWSAIAWLLIALLIASIFCLFFFWVGRAQPDLGHHWMVRLGFLASAALVAIALLNAAEYAALGGVTDYLAMVDLETKRVRVINIADIVVVLASVAAVVGQIGATVELVRRSISRAGVT